MTGDQIVGVIAIMGMLLLVVPRLVNDQAPGPKMVRMALLWILVVAVVTVTVLLLRPNG